MRAPSALVGIAAVLCAAALTAAPDAAAVDSVGGLPLPTVSVTPLPTSTPVPVPKLTAPTLPLPTTPVPTTPSVPTLPGLPSPPPGVPTLPGGTPAPLPGAPGGVTKPGDNRGAAGSGIGPMVAGTPEAATVLDDETTPAMLKASQAFLAADQAIASITAEQKALDNALAVARQAFGAYLPTATDVTGAQTTALRVQDRYIIARRALTGYVNVRYRTGSLSAGSEDAAQTLADSVNRLDDTVTRAELRVGALSVQLAQIRQQYAEAALVYAQTYRALANAKARLAVLAAQRSAALSAMNAAKAGDLQLNASRMVESGRLGAQIRALSARLRATGATVNGTGTFIRPGHGPITSPFGMRYHPILHYVKLHTGTDFGHSDGVIEAADDGVVIMTVANRAYGNMTVIDHGTIGGRHIVTMYAHQARFLVKEGQRVKKGDIIGVIGATGYATGPHLHFEVRDDGAVENPAPWLPGNGS
jgi:murein DD-endopeptidase MepM/ murein hydrolase activator NlpD